MQKESILEKIDSFILKLILVLIFVEIAFSKFAILTRLNPFLCNEIGMLGN